MAQKAVWATARATMEPISAAGRTSFPSDFFLDESNFISINLHSRNEVLMKDPGAELKEKDGGSSGGGGGGTADGLFFESKLLPFWQVLQRSRELNDRIGFGDDRKADDGKAAKREERKTSRFVVDDDGNPSPRPPRCTVLWKELLRLKKQRASSSRGDMKTRKGLYQYK
ncbi:hypothetical protein V6N13_128904 [Hibiscus sabdariffa]|uniref:Uncharacterized protein n=2 Tax=Hibiscus sabdariffa TaxID=183260 RepID=A0ABR2SK79_9ROSI